jgi:hypothetical protein
VASPVCGTYRAFLFRSAIYYTMNFKSFASDAQLSEYEIYHLDNIREFLNAAYLCDNKTKDLVTELSEQEISFLAHGILEDMMDFMEAEDDENKPKAKKKKRGFFGDVHHVEKKKRFMRPDEMGAATDEITKDYSKFLQPRKFILAAAKELAAKQGGKWEDFVTQVNPREVLARMRAKGIDVPDEKKAAHQIKATIAKIAQSPSGPGLGGFEKKIASGFEERWPDVLRKYVKEQEPIVAAIKELGVNTPTDEIINNLEAQNIPILSPNLQKFLSVEKLKDVANKAQQGEALTGEEQRIYQIWKQSGRPITPQDAMSAFRAFGSQINPRYLQGTLVDLVKNDVRRNLGYQENPEVQDKSHLKKWQRQVSTWQKDKQTNPKAVPYVVSDYHASEAIPNPQINSKYFDQQGHFNSYGYEQIVKAACIGSRSALASRLMAHNFPIFQLRLFDDRSMSGGLCGVNRLENDKTMEKINNFLHGTTFDDIVKMVILSNKEKGSGVNGLLASSNLPGWETQEGIRVARANIVAARIIDKIMRQKRQAYAATADIAGQGRSAMQRDVQRASVGNPGEDDAEAMHKRAGLFDPETIRAIMSNPEIMIPKLRQVIAAEQDPAQRQALQGLLDQLMAKIQQPTV